MLSNKLMEYVALGVPAVVSRWPTYEHYFPDDAVSYFRPGDADDLAAAILRVWRQPETAARRAARAAELYQTYRWKVQRQKYLDVYASLGTRPKASECLGVSVAASLAMSVTRRSADGVSSSEPLVGRTSGPGNERA
jgi:hypothetical protein